MMDQVYNQFNSQSIPGMVPKPAPARSEGILANLTKNISHDFKNTDLGDFTDCDYWTAQTFMLRSIRDWFFQAPLSPQFALSVDKNPVIDNIMLQRWPELQIHRAIYPDFDAQDLSGIADNQYDLVYSNQILEHVPKPWVAAGEMVRVLKPGGVGLHTSCAYNPRHGLPKFNDYYRFLPDGLAELFDGVHFYIKDGWGNKEAWLYNLAIDDGFGVLGGRRFHQKVGQKNDPDYPWHVWVIFGKL